jgi:Bacterial Ig-like domain
VTSVWPFDGATDVSLEMQPSAEFSEAIDPASLTTSTFVLRNETSVVVPATVSYNDSVSAATLIPSAALAPGTTYTATVMGGAGGVKDVAGNPMASSFVWSFTTVVADPTPPTVTAVTPANGATGVSTTTGVRATFSERILSSTLTTDTFVLRSPANAVVPATVSYNGLTSVGTLIPLAALAPFTTYTVTITGGSAGIKDRTGNPMAGDAVWSFTTTSAVITVGLTTIGTSIDTGNSNFMNGSKVSTTAAGQISSMSVYVGAVDSMAAKRQYQLAIYTDNAGRPGTLVAASATGTLVADAWNTLGVSASLLGNRNYWLMFNTNGRTGAVNNMRYENGAAGQGAYSSASVAFGTWPATFPAVTTSNFVYSLFATSAPITVGLTAIGSSRDSGNSNSVHGSKVTTTAAAELSSISVFVGKVDPMAANRQYQLAIYSDDAGGLGTRVATSEIGTLVANAWNTLPVSASLARGTDYWLVYNTNGRTASVNNMFYNTGAAAQGTSSGCCAFGTWPAFFGSMGTNFVYSLFATFGP